MYNRERKREETERERTEGKRRGEARGDRVEEGRERGGRRERRKWRERRRGERRKKMDRRGSTYHNGEHDTDLLHRSEDAQQGQEYHLHQRVGIDPAVRNVPQVLIVWLVLVGHQW